jgi:hypothetical protein
VVLGGEVRVRRSVVLGVLGAGVLFVGAGVLIVSRLDYCEPPTEAGDTEVGEFPDHFVSDRALLEPASKEIRISIIGAADKTPVPVLAYCLAFSDGRWACGRTDGAGRVEKVYDAHDVTLYSGDEALRFWRSRLGRGEYKNDGLARPNCSPVDSSSTKSSGVVFECVGW